MKKAFTPLLMSLFCFALPLFAQEQPAPKFELRGLIRNRDSAVIPGLKLMINNEYSSLTDINGEFRIPLSEGDYVLTADALVRDKFRAFIKISEKGLNPNYLEFVVNSDAIVCSGNRGKPSPKVISSAEPSYPPAARAVRAGGEVIVIVKVSSDGKVSSAKAISGHPLLRRASEVAAGKFLFESDEGVAERETTITFVFLPDQDVKEGVKRYSCPYRIILHSEAVILYTTNTH